LRKWQFCKNEDDIEDINLDELIATAMDDPQAIPRRSRLQGC
jgi:hypothetical protein